MIKPDFALRKAIRKIKSDGVISFILSSIETLVRNYFGEYIINYLINNSIIRTVSREELQQNSVENVNVLNNSDELLPFVSVIKNGRFFPCSGLILTENFEIIEESVGGQVKSRRNILAALSRQVFFSGSHIKELFSETDAVLAENLSITGPVAAPTMIYPNYFHWMAVAVHQVHYIQSFEEIQNKKVTILIPAEAPPFVEETLKLLNWPSSSVKYIERPIHGIQEFLIPSHTDQHRDFEWLTNTILENVCTEENSEEESDNGNNIYISRANAVERRVVNEKEVVDMLSQYGFSSYRLEERTVAENVRLFANADVIVGPHGAGLTDIIFSSDATVIELFGYQSVEKKPTYKKLSDIIGVDYESMQCTANSVDMIVDVDELENRVSDALDK
jgi:hypothetical protein